MPGVQPPRWDLAPAALIPGEGVWVLLKDLDATPPVIYVKLQDKSIPHARGPQVNEKGEGEHMSYQYTVYSETSQCWWR